MRLSLIYPANLTPGMLVGGTVDTTAPTTPFQPFAAAMHVVSVERSTAVQVGDDGRVNEPPGVAPIYGPGLRGEFYPHSGSRRLVVIED